MLKEKVNKIVKNSIGKKAELEHPSEAKFGDFSTNIALKEKIDAKEIAGKLKDNPLFEKVEAAGRGFINFFLSKEAFLDELSEILDQKENYGNLKYGQGKKIQVEFISANPTGPLTVGNARGGPYGDVLANVLSKAGYEAEKAYYVNDAGQQILALGHSVIKDDQAKYQGKYIDELAEKIKEKDPSKAGKIAAKHIINDSIKKTTDKLGIKYDEWIFESDLYQSGKVDQTLKFLEEKGLIYKEDGAQWFASSKFGDERDRVVVKSDGEKTYLAGDIALHSYKFNDKKFDQVINVWGADHHGDVPGLMAGAEALGDKGKLDIILLQFVTLLEKGEKKKMSKRAGIYVLMDELIDKVGSDAAKWFFLQKSPDTHLNFDVDLAQEQSSKNPVYYVQYAHARICSILNKAKKENLLPDRVGSLEGEEEIDLVRQLIKFPEIIEDIARDYQVQRLPQYALELANSFHKFYENCRVIDENNQEKTVSRLSLAEAARIVLESTLKLMGISAPNKM
ncbi:arginine--tRNA ligase [Patescibacteria group bacterium]|nr:arginine--tRNA ligase [Patescibacteria group bacterium]